MDSKKRLRVVSLIFMTMDISSSPRTATEVDACAEKWIDTCLEIDPRMHVWLGRPGGEGKYADYSPEGAQARIAHVRYALNELQRCVPQDDIDRVTVMELSRELQLEIEKHEAGVEECDLNVIDSPAQGLREIFDLMPKESEEDWAQVLERLGHLPEAMTGYIASLRLGIQHNNTPALRQVEQVYKQAVKLAASDGFFVQLAQQSEHKGFLSQEMSLAVEACAEAYDQFAKFLKTKLAPCARSEDAFGRDRYALASRYFLGAQIDLDETYEWGIEELSRMVAEQERIANVIQPGASVREAVEILDADASSKLYGTQELQRWMQRVSDEAIENLGSTHFEISEPMKRLECLIAPTQEGGIYYTGPSDDFVRPGRMWWSVPEGVIEFDTWRELTTVYHEGVPGHHLQIAQATYNKDQLNAWRRLAGTSGHAEGWALYAERLMQDLGYLENPADLFGMLDGQRMRAARVVIDIGVHLRKNFPGSSRPWRGEDAFEFLAKHVNMNQGFIDFEVNRYLGWPGQAPSYKVGQRVWENVRDEYAKAQGNSFDIKDFHKKALALGGVGLDTLRYAFTL